MLQALRSFLLIAWVLIVGVTLYAVIREGLNWPAVFFGDLVGHPWRSQFNTDFLIHLFLLAFWVFWREESKVKGAIFGFLSIFGGGLFGFMYILVASVRAGGDPKKMLLGHHAK